MPYLATYLGSPPQADTTDHTYTRWMQSIVGASQSSRKQRVCLRICMYAYVRLALLIIIIIMICPLYSVESINMLCIAKYRSIAPAV